MAYVANSPSDGENTMKLCIEVDREEDGRWIADIPALPGVMVYGSSEVEALNTVKALALHVIADLTESGGFESISDLAFISNQALVE